MARRGKSATPRAWVSDMNRLRQAVGDPALNYLGLSYGTGLGATYANLIPATAGHMVLDGNLDPVAWTRGGALPSSLRRGSDLATAATMRAFLNLCGRATTAACAFSAGTPAATRAKFAALLHRLAGCGQPGEPRAGHDAGRRCGRTEDRLHRPGAGHCRDLRGHRGPAQAARLRGRHPPGRTPGRAALGCTGRGAKSPARDGRVPRASNSDAVQLRAKLGRQAVLPGFRAGRPPR
jgi:pimeloyl-ACP methyl ester carboxylesterase